MKISSIFAIIPRTTYCILIAIKKVIGKFKDECNGNIMTERISLKSKMYAHRIYNCKAECKRAKGLKKCIVRKDLNFDKYDDALMNIASTSHSYLHFKSKNHQIYTVRSAKKDYLHSIQKDFI